MLIAKRFYKFYHYINIWEFLFLYILINNGYYYLKAFVV